MGDKGRPGVLDSPLHAVWEDRVAVGLGLKVELNSQLVDENERKKILEFSRSQEIETGSGKLGSDDGI